MKQLRLFRLRYPTLATTTLLFFFCFVCFFVGPLPAATQTRGSRIFASNQQVQVSNLPSLTSRSADPSAILVTALETAIHDRAVCCGRDSGLEDAVLSSPPSLASVAPVLQGKHVLSDGLSVVVHAEYVSKGAVNPGLIVSTLLEQRPMLLEWKSRIYVLYGAIYDETSFESGDRLYEIHKLLLLDLRFADRRRNVEFDKATDDWESVQGLLTLAVTRP